MYKLVLSEKKLLMIFGLKADQIYIKYTVKLVHHSVIVSINITERNSIAFCKR